MLDYKFCEAWNKLDKLNEAEVIKNDNKDYFKQECLKLLDSWTQPESHWFIKVDEDEWQEIDADDVKFDFDDETGIIDDDNIEYRSLPNEMEEIAQYFMQTTDGRVAILFNDIPKVYDLCQTATQKQELNKMFNLIIKSKYDRDETDAKQPTESRLAIFKKIFIKEYNIKNTLQKIYPEYTFEFAGKDINDTNEHYWLFSGYGTYGADLIVKPGDIQIEIKSTGKKEKEQQYNADLIIRYGWDKDTQNTLTCTFEITDKGKQNKNCLRFITQPLTFQVSIPN